MPRYSYETWASIVRELWNTPGRRDLLLKALEEAGEPGTVLKWTDFKRTVAACIAGMQKSCNRVSDFGLYVPEVLEENKNGWEQFHVKLTGELTRRKESATGASGREPGGGIFADGTGASFSLAQELLDLGAGNARLAVRMCTFGGDVNPTFLRGRRTCHITCDDQDGQGAKDARKTGKKKITFFYDLCDRDCKRGYYLVGWGVHNGGTQYRLEGVIPPMGGSLDALRQWCVGMTVQCGTEKK